MAEPQPKAIELPSFLRRLLPQWTTPNWTAAERWRQVVRSQPVAIIARDNIIANVLASSWAIMARDQEQQDDLEADIDYYTNQVLNDLIQDFDTKMEETLQDTLDLPIGGNMETLRWPPGQGPPGIMLDPKGVVHRILHVDGATLYPTHDLEFPMAQRVRGELGRIVLFGKDEMGRILMNARPELQRSGFGMPPPEKIFLALVSLSRGDTYYSNLLLDTPEAGILDLADMTKQNATDWVQSFMSILQGIDPQKIGILYEHQQPAKYIPFGRPPTEMMFDAITIKYARLVVAGYNLTLSDIGLEPGGSKTLAGEIRSERKARRGGYGLIKEKVRNFLNRRVLPPWLEFVWIEADEEATVLRYRAYTLASSAMKNLVESKILRPVEAQEQLKKDGLLTVEVEEPEPPQPMPAVFAQRPEGIDDENDKVPAAEGGRGELTGRADVEPVVTGDERITAVPPMSEVFGQMQSVIGNAFTQIVNGAGEPQLIRLIRAATRGLFPTVEKAFVTLTDDGEIPIWLDQRLAMWFGDAEIRKADQATLDELDDLLDAEDWWRLPSSVEEQIFWVITQAFSQGASVAADIAQEALYLEGLVSSPTLIGLNFTLTNPETLRQLELHAANLVTRINDGSKFFIKRIITSGVEEGLSSPKIAQMIRDGESVEAVLREAGFTQGVVDTAKNELSKMGDARTTSIVNTEVAKAETEGRVTEWNKMGLTKKRWVHTGPDVPCPFCQANQDAGFVAMSFMYETVFGPATATGPPAHPNVDHCHIEFDEEELISKAGELNVWAGE